MDYLETKAMAARKRVQQAARKQQQEARDQAERLRRQATKEASAREKAAEIEKKRLRRETKVAKTSRELPGYQVVATGQKASITAIEKQQASTSQQLTTINKEIDKALADTSKEIEIAASTAAKDIKKFETEYADFKAANVQLKNGEWIDKAAFEGLSKKDQLQLTLWGTAKFAEYKDKQFKTNTVELKNGEYVDRKWYESLTASDRRLLWREGVKNFNKTAKQEYKDSTVRLKNGERVDKEFYNSLDSEDKAVLYKMGIVGFNASKKAEYINTTKLLKNGERVDKEFYNSLDSEAKKILDTTGVKGFNSWTRFNQLQIEKKYKKIDADTYVDRKWYESLSTKDQKFLFGQGLDAFNKKIKKQAEKDRVELLKTSIYLQEAGEYVNKDEFNALPPSFRAILTQKGVEGLKEYVDKNYIAVAATGELIDKKTLVGMSEEDKTWLINYGVQSYSNLKDFQFNAVNQKLNDGTYVPKGSFAALDPADQKALIKLGVEGYNKAIQDKAKKIEKDFIKQLPAETQTYIKEHGIDNYNKWIDKADQSTSPGHELAIYQALGLAPKEAMPAGYNANGEIQYFIPGADYGKGKTGWEIAGYVAKMVVPGAWASDWNKMSTGEKATNIAIDVATLLLIFAKPIAGALRPLPKGMSKIAATAGKEWQTLAKITKILKKSTSPLLDAKTAMRFKKSLQIKKPISMVAELKLIGTLNKIQKLSNIKSLAKATKGLSTAEVKLLKALKAVDKTKIGTAKYSKAVARVEAAKANLVKSLTTRTKAPVSIFASIQASKAADLKLIEVLSSVTKLTRGQLGKIERLSKIKGLAKTTRGLSKAQVKLAKAWKAVNKTKIGTTRYTKAIVKAQAAQTNFIKSLTRYEDLLARKVKPTWAKIKVGGKTQGVLRVRNNPTAWYAGEWDYIINNTERELKALQNEFSRIEKTALPSERREMVKAVHGMEDTLANYRQAAKAGNLPPQVKDWKFVNISEKENIPVLFDELPKFTRPPGGAASEVVKPGATATGEAFKTGGVGVAVEVQPTLGLRFETKEIIKSGLMPLTYEEARPVMQLAAPKLAPTGKVTPVLAAKIIPTEAAISQAATTMQLSPALAADLRLATAKLEATAIKNYTKAITQSIISSMPAASASISTAVNTVTKAAITSAIQSAISNATKADARTAILTSTTTAAKAVTGVDARSAISVYTKPIIDSAIKAFNQVSIETAALTAAAPAVKTATVTKVTTATGKATGARIATRVTGRAIPPPFIKPPEEKGKRRMTEAEMAGAVQWKQGLFYVMLYPYKGNSNNYKMEYQRTPYPGINIASGLRSAYDTIRKVGGELPPIIKRDMGIMDITIRTPKGGKPKIQFTRDEKVIRQATKI